MFETPDLDSDSAKSNGFQFFAFGCLNAPTALCCEDPQFLAATEKVLCCQSGQSAAKESMCIYMPEATI